MDTKKAKFLSLILVCLLWLVKLLLMNNSKNELVYLINCEEYSREGKSTVYGVKLPYILGKTNDDDSLLHIIYRYMSAAI